MSAASTKQGPRGSKLVAADLESATPFQVKRLKGMAKTVAGLKIGKRLADGTLIVSGKPGWEQGRWATDAAGAKLWTPNYGRVLTWALDSEGKLHGQGWTKTITEAHVKAGVTLLDAPTAPMREKLAKTTAAVRLPGTVARVAARAAKKADKAKAKGTAKKSPAVKATEAA